MNHSASEEYTESSTTEAQRIRNALRAEAKQIRSELPAPYRAHKSAELCKRLEESLALTLGITAIDARDAIIAVYAAFPEEVDLTDFINHAYDLGCTVAFPCMIRDAWGTPDAHSIQEASDAHHPSPAGCTPHFTTQTMEMRAIPANHFRADRVPFLNNPLKYFNHESSELADYPYCAADSLTMIVVPVVGFDKHGNRLGYGAGNYDRYLTQIPPTCRVVGVAFAEQEVDDIPTEEHDIPMAIMAL